MTKIYRISVDCANCAARMERAAARVKGVESLTINFMALKLHVTFCDGADPEDVMPAVLKACRRISRDCEICL